MKRIPAAILIPAMVFALVSCARGGKTAMGTQTAAESVRSWSSASAAETQTEGFAQRTETTAEELSAATVRTTAGTTVSGTIIAVPTMTRKAIEPAVPLETPKTPETPKTSKKPETPKTTQGEMWTNHPIEIPLSFTTETVAYGIYRDPKDYPRAQMMLSAQALADYLNANAQNDRDDSAEQTSEEFAGLRQKAEKYDDAWFKTHRLIVLELSESSGSIRNTVRSVRRMSSRGSFCVTLERDCPQVQTCDMAFYYVFIELDGTLEEGSTAVTVEVQNV